MLSFSTLTVLAIATQSLFANVDAAVLRQSFPLDLALLDPLTRNL